MSPAFRDGLFWVAVASCAVSQLFILRAVLRVLPSTDASAEPSGVPSPNRTQEIVWAILPAALLGAAFFGAWRAMHPSVTL